MNPPNDALTVFIGKVTGLIIQPIILLLFALAMFYFVNGMITFIAKSDDPKARETGRTHMIWGVVGFFIMVSVFTILRIATNTLFPGVSLPGGN
jgi:Na+-driven multidrug efflux pump